MRKSKQFLDKKDAGSEPSKKEKKHKKDEKETEPVEPPKKKQKKDKKEKKWSSFSSVKFDWNAVFLRAADLSWSLQGAVGCDLQQ